MKYILIFILTCACIYPQNVITKLSDDQPGGIFLPAEGRIHALFIFAQFPDDNFQPDNELWRKNDVPQKIKDNSWVDADWTGNHTQYSMTDYFNEMSFGKLKFTGKSISVIAPNTRQWYIDNKKKLKEIHTDILAIADKQIDFAEFDNWKKLSNFNHQAEPDGIVDMIFFVWRNIHLDVSAEDKPAETLGKLGFGWLGTSGVRDILVDDGKRKVMSQSGVTIQDFFSKDAFRFCIHEFAHYLIGGNEFHNGYAFWAVLNGYGSRSFMVNAFERHRLGWSDIQTIPLGKGPTDIVLKDFITTGDAARIEINAKNNLYFYLENHQRISKWDESSADKNEKGVYVIRRDFYASDNKFMQLVPADGRHKWEVVGYAYPDYYPKGVPVFRRLAPDRKEGYLDTEFIPFKYEGKDYPSWEVLFYMDDKGKPVEIVEYRGDGTDAFRPDYKNVFSPWSNPPSVLLKFKPTGIGFYLKSVNNGNVSLTVYTDSSTVGPPSKPDRPSLTEQGNNLIISWTKNEEPDAAGYKIYRIDDSGKEELIGNTDVNTIQFQYSGGSNSKNIKIKISCIDKNKEESIKSEIGEWIQ